MNQDECVIVAHGKWKSPKTKNSGPDVFGIIFWIHSKGDTTLTCPDASQFKVMK